MNYEEKWEVIEEDLTSGDIRNLSKAALEEYRQLGENFYEDKIANLDPGQWLGNNKFYVGGIAASATGHLLLPSIVDLGPLNSVVYDETMHFTFGASTGGIGGVVKTLSAEAMGAKEAMDISNGLGYLDSAMDFGLTASGIYFGEDLKDYMKGEINKIKDKV